MNNAEWKPLTAEDIESIFRKIPDVPRPLHLGIELLDKLVKAGLNLDDYIVTKMEHNQDWYRLEHKNRSKKHE